MRVQYIEVRITLEDGEIVEGSISPDGDQRWGNDLPHIAACVRPMEDMAEALAEHWVCDEEDD